MFSLEEISAPIVASNSSVEAEVLKAKEELKRHENFLLKSLAPPRLGKIKKANGIECNLLKIVAL